MAGVQRTRIGYGNEGRAKQLAASLSEFIRVFTIQPPPATQHSKSLVMPGSRGGLQTVSPSFALTHEGCTAAFSSPSIFHLHHCDLYDPI